MSPDGGRCCRRWQGRLMLWLRIFGIYSEALGVIWWFKEEMVRLFLLRGCECLLLEDMVGIVFKET